MRPDLRFVSVILVGLIVLSSLSLPANNPHQGAASFAKYTEIPGAKPVGADQCAACHSEVATDFRHAYHAQQGVDCESCHGPGSLHVEGGGDISRIISFSHRSATEANGVCLSCHAKDAKVRNWMTGTHASNHVRCIDCHQTHVYGAKDKPGDAFVDVLTPARVSMVEDRVPEAKTVIQPKWKTNDACLKCHQTQRGEMSLPYHHPLREGKMSCADCHDPHGGPGGNNLRTANTNQLCLGCHTQYRGPFAYQHPPVSENCMLCHTPHGSPNTNLLSVSEPALCMQCHTAHHNGAGLPLTDRCTNCHGSIHGTDTPTPSGGSRFIDKGPTDPQLRAMAQGGVKYAGAHSGSPSSALARPVPAHSPSLPIGAAGGTLGMASQYLSSNMAPLSGAGMGGGSNDPAEIGGSDSAYSIIPGSYRFVDITGFGGRVGEYDSLEQSAGADLATSYVSPQNHLTVVTRGTVLTGKDYQAASQLTAGEWARINFDMRSFVQQQDHYPFYAFPVLDVAPGTTGAPDSTTDLIPSHVPFGVVRRLGKANAQFKLPKLPVHLFINGDWQARSGTAQLPYLDENVTPSCGEQCHFQSQFQAINYTTRNVGGGADIDLGSVRMTYQHTYSSFNDRQILAPVNYASTVTFAGPFPNEDEGICTGPYPPGLQCPIDIPAGNYTIDLPSPNEASTDSLSLNWTASPALTFNGNVSYSRLRDRYTNYPQNAFDTDETLNWRPIDRLRLSIDYHQQNLINNFTPFYNGFGNVSYHNHREGLRLEYELPRGFDIEAHYQRSGITRSNSFLWPQIYSIDNTDLQTVIPSSTSNTAGLALRYHDRGLWSARAGYEWTGTNNPGYLTVPESNNRIFTNFTLTPANWLVFSNDTNIIVQNAFAAIPLPNTPGNFERRNRFYINTASATFRPLPVWNFGLGYSYQQNNLTTYMAFQNDSGVNYVFDQPAVPYKQISQSYWGDTSYTVKQRLGLNLRVTYNSARSGYRPDVNPNDAALLGNQALITAGTFDPVMFAAAQSNMAFSSTQISEVIVPQWIGQSKAYYLFPHKFEGGLLFYYGSYRDHWNNGRLIQPGLNAPYLNGDLRTFNLFVGRTW
jgi:predicted CXXCH cytochrome family protein